MLAFLKIAWRDLWRHKMRSGLTLAAVVFGSALTLFFMALGLAAAGKALYGAVLEMRAKLRASDREKEDEPRS